uniref:Uncharacterized protein n=1 Tax=Ditylum brightwellii TaxID=49249 RepID=A0A7S4S597_9STRA
MPQPTTAAKTHNVTTNKRSRNETEFLLIIFRDFDNKSTFTATMTLRRVLRHYHHHPSLSWISAIISNANDCKTKNMSYPNINHFGMCPQKYLSSLVNTIETINSSIKMATFTFT